MEKTGLVGILDMEASFFAIEFYKIELLKWKDCKWEIYCEGTEIGSIGREIGLRPNFLNWGFSDLLKIVSDNYLVWRLPYKL